MVHKRHGQCIFSCENKRCVNESTETFKDIICPYHLSQVFGLKVDIKKFEKESTDFYVGPYLILDDSFCFEPNTVVFPEREFIDQHMCMNSTKDNFYTYKLNPRMHNYLNNLVTNTFNCTLSERRYQIEIIRNLFFVLDLNLLNTGGHEQYGNRPVVDINLAAGTENSNKELKVEIETRFQQLNSIIQTEDYNENFKKIEILTVNKDQKIPLTTFNPFMRFMIFNCLTDEHKLPLTKDDAVGIMCNLNLIYIQGIGFVTTQTILNPSNLIVLGITKGNNNYYQLKVRAVPKRTVPNTNVYKKSLADNVRSSNILNPQQDFCWTKR